MKFWASCALLALSLGLASVGRASTCEWDEARERFADLDRIWIERSWPGPPTEPDALLTIRGRGFDELARFEELSLEFVSFGSGGSSRVDVADAFMVLADDELVANVPLEAVPGRAAVRLVSGDCSYVYRDLGNGWQSGYSSPPVEIAYQDGLWFGSPGLVRQSLPGAPAVLYLDLNGQLLPDFDARLEDGTSEVLLDVVAEANPAPAPDLEDIWRRVAEDFAPFDVNVTTDPRVYLETLTRPGFGGIHERIVLGGDQEDIGLRFRGAVVGGVADLGSHRSVVPADRHGPRTPKQTAMSVSHEAGHQFSGYLLRKTRLETDYITHRDAGRPGTAAIMGTPAADRREVWTDGIARDGRPHDEVRILREVLGLRADPQGPANASTARLESFSWRSLRGVGVIESRQDRDAFLFWAEPGTFTLVVDTINYSADDHAANLDADIELWRAGDGSPLVDFAARKTTDPLSAVLRYTVAAGEEGLFYVVVKGRGEYGDLGQYQVFANGPGVRVASQPKLAPPARTPTLRLKPTLQLRERATIRLR